MTVHVAHADVVLFFLTCRLVVSAKPPLAVGVHDVRIAWLWYGRARLAPADCHPKGRLPPRPRDRRKARHHDRAVVLLARIDPIGKPVVDVHLIQFGGGLV